jgi:very-short-patch-repair endonuclease
VSIPGVIVHQLSDVLPSHRTEARGFPTTTPARTIVDLAAVVSPFRLATAVEHVVVERLATFGAIAQVLSDVRCRGKPGVRKLVSVLDSRGGQPPPGSVLERKLLRAAEMARVEVVRQHALPWAREPVVGLVDAAVISSRLILEADGRRWHARTQAMANDRRRDREAVLAGWLPLRWVHEDLEDLPAVAREIAAIHASRVSEPRIPRV